MSEKDQLGVRTNELRQLSRVHLEIRRTPRQVADHRAKFHQAIDDIPEILECYTVFGEMDAMLKVLAPDVNWYQDFIFSTILKLPGVVDVRSIVTLSESKYTTAVPLRARKFR